jgi:hypothetical protein
MRSKALLTAALALSLSACGTLYTKSHDWKLPAGLGRYTITARMDVGLLTRTATILVNDKTILTGEAWFWSDTIDMDGTVDHFPIHALCSKSAKTCDVSIAGFHAATLSF